MEPLTPRQEMILDFIRQSIRERGYPPTLREIGARMGIRSTNGVNDHLRALERKGHLTREDMKSRTLRVVDDRARAAAPGVDNIEVPLVGRVAAGPLNMTAQQDVEAHLSMDPTLLRAAVGAETFALRVRGDSMIEAGIFDGDILFVRRQETANRGDIVVALVGDEATVKRFYPERDHVRLQPENRRLAPIYVRRGDSAGFRVLGLVIGLYRAVTATRVT